jgi:hypothetical protein
VHRQRSNRPPAAFPQVRTDFIWHGQLDQKVKVCSISKVLLRRVARSSHDPWPLPSRMSQGADCRPPASCYFCVISNSYLPKPAFGFSEQTRYQ